ncbi:helix-turn-helix domain-containing protein [Serratia symbiotica]|uniref:helix-turn-helix domain-containing protein n=1 Tax=Serratia symbiotica TaxID=138074 RepID=UPI001CEFB828|nr:helix-turn-helix transcriptional regulator [Serratia symbiotica]
MVIKSQVTRIKPTMAASISSEEQVFMMELGDRISALRKEAGLTQVQMAEALNVSQQAVQSWEAGRRRIQIPILPAVAKILSVSLEGLLGEEAENAPRKRGPASRLEQQIQMIGQLPKSKQKLVSEMLDAVIAQAQQAGTDG